jgi:hypothetical protein
MTWSELLAHVKNVEACEESEAKRQIHNAADDGVLRYRWEHARPAPSGTGGVTVPQGPVYSHTSDYWRTCVVDPTDPDRILEPPRYDSWVDAKSKARLEKMRRFRKPLFERECVLKIWPVPPRPASKRRPTDRQVKKFVADYIADCNLKHLRPTLDHLEEWAKEENFPDRKRLRDEGREQLRAAGFTVARGHSRKSKR